MKNSVDKARDMRRAILASSRDVRRARRLIHHQERGHVRVLLRALDEDQEPVADVVGPTIHARHAISELVGDRRGADRHSLFVRWVEGRVRTRPGVLAHDFDGRTAHFRRLLGDSTVGLHALAHARSALRSDDPWRRLTRRR